MIGSKPSRTSQKGHDSFRFFLFLSLFLIYFSFLTGTGYGEEKGSRHLFLCIDSIPYSVFDRAVQEGLFDGFQPASRMISTFPALTNYAWSVILNTGTVEGYQTRYYNPDLNKIEGGFQDLFKSKGFPNKFDYIEENLVSQLAAYILGRSSIDKKMNNLGEKILESNTPRVFFAFIGVTDIIAHMKGEKGLLQLLDKVDSGLIRIRKEHREKFGEELEVTMVSDHANTLQKGEVIDVYKFLKENDFNPVKKLRTPDDVIYHTSGILSVAPFYIQELRKLELARKLSVQPWVELVAARHEDRETFLVFSKKGALSFKHNQEEDSFRIESLTGEDPIGFIREGIPVNEWVPQSQVFRASLETNFPDILKRIQMALDGKQVRYPASVLVSIKFGYESGSDRLMNFLSKLKKNRFGTHGGLADLDSVGFIASTRQVFSQWVPARSVHTLIEGIDFATKYEALTFLWTPEGECQLRLGQPLFALPEAATVRFRIKTLANEKYTLSNSAACYALDLASLARNDSPADSFTFLDVALPVPIQSGSIYQIQAQVLDKTGRILSQTRIPPFPIKHVRGYIRIPFDTFFDPPKKKSHKYWAQANPLLPN